jgi:hypothetical protein
MFALATLQGCWDLILLKILRLLTMSVGRVLHIFHYIITFSNKSLVISNMEYRFVMAVHFLGHSATQWFKMY